MTTALIVLAGLAAYAAVVILLGHFIHAGGATRAATPEGYAWGEFKLDVKPWPICDV